MTWADGDLAECKTKLTMQLWMVANAGFDKNQAWRFSGFFTELSSTFRG